LERALGLHDGSFRHDAECAELPKRNGKLSSDTDDADASTAAWPSEDEKPGNVSSGDFSRSLVTEPNAMPIDAEA
jgi:hypothetical protein